VLAVDPRALKARAAATHAERGVFVQPADDGATATLSVFHVAADRAVAAYERVDAIARGLRRAGDPRTLDQLRADTVLDLIDGIHPLSVPPIHRRGVVELTIPLATALGTGSEPGELAGYGPVLADVARQIAVQQRDAQWRFSVTHQGEFIYQGVTRARPGGAGDPDQSPRDAAGRPGTARTINDRTAAASASAASDHQAGETRITNDRTAAAPASAASTGRAGKTRSASSPSGYFAAIDNESGDNGPFVTAGRPATPVPRPPMEQDLTSRVPGVALKRWIQMRDRTCRAPGCTAPAYACDIDHTIEHHDGGATCACNLGPLCRHHHPGRHNGYWTLVQPSPGVFVWVTRHGQVYRRID
jgi:hypothetical protein